jgi:hypothetical protein
MYFVDFYYYVLKNNLTVRARNFADLSSQNHDFKSSLETAEKLTNLQLLFFKKLQSKVVLNFTLVL